MGPHRVNRGPLATKENRHFFGIFLIFPAYGKNGLRWPQIGPGGFFPTNPDLANILGRTDLNFENFYFFHFLDPKFLDFQVPEIWISRLPKNPHGGRGGGRTDGRTPHLILAWGVPGAREQEPSTTNQGERNKDQGPRHNSHSSSDGQIQAK